MKIYIFGNGNIKYEDFEKWYLTHIRTSLEQKEVSFIICDFRGTDTLVMEYLKTKTHRVTVLHIGKRPRYFPDTFKTEAGKWEVKGGFHNDAERDEFAIQACTHFIAKDFNSDENRKSGTLRNIERCLALEKIQIT